MTRSYLVLCLLLAAPLASPPILSAQGAATEPDHVQVVRQALEAYEAANWVEARTLFGQVFEMRPSAEALRMMGNASFEMGEYSEAASLLQRSLSFEERPLNGERREQAEAALERAASHLGMVSLTVEPAEFELLIDGELRAIEEARVFLRPGTHTLHISADGFDSYEREIQVSPGSVVELVIDLDAPGEPEELTDSSAEPSHWIHSDALQPLGGWSLVAGGGLFTITGLSLGLAGYRQARNTDQVTGPEADRAKNLGIAGDVLLFTGLAAAAAGTIWIVMDRRADGDDDQLSIDAFVTPTAAGITARGKF